MARTLLQEMAEVRTFESLPANSSSFDLKSFSRQKQLWDYRQQVVATAHCTRSGGGQRPDICYNRDAAQSDELHRRFWVGSIGEFLQRVNG